MRGWRKALFFGVDGGDWKPRSARLRRDCYKIGRRAWIEEHQKGVEAPILPESRSKISPTKFSIIRSEVEGKSEAFLSASNCKQDQESCTSRGGKRNTVLQTHPECIVPRSSHTKALEL
jgi:hypothetical protein